jgi:hypothetical protein
VTAVLLRAGAEVEIPSVHEIRGTMEEVWAAHERAKVRGKKRMELLFPVQPAATTVFLGPADAGGMAEEGYIWSLKMVSVNFSASSTLNIYKSSNSGDTRRPLCPTLAAATVQSFSWSSDAARLRHGEGLYLVGSATITGVYVAAWQVPAEQEAEIYD